MKSYFKSKTMWVGLGMGLLGVFQQVAADAPIPAEWNGLVMSGFGAATMILRSVTTQPVGSTSE